MGASPPRRRFRVGKVLVILAVVGVVVALVGRK